MSQIDAGTDHVLNGKIKNITKKRKKNTFFISHRSRRHRSRVWTESVAYSRCRCQRLRAIAARCARRRVICACDARSAQGALQNIFSLLSPSFQLIKKTKIFLVLGDAPGSSSNFKDVLLWYDSDVNICRINLFILGKTRGLKLGYESHTGCQ